MDEPYHDPWLPHHGPGPWGYAEYPDRKFHKDEWKFDKDLPVEKLDESGGRRFGT